MKFWALVLVLAYDCSSTALARQARTDSLHTTAQYFSSLHAADSLTFMREFEWDFRLLLDASQLHAYDSLATLAQRKRYVEVYWRAVDPAPLLVENDRLLDHLRRRLYVRKNFAQHQPPFFDDRGKYYLKYGKPAVRYEDSGGIRRVRFFNSANYDLLRRMYALKNQPEQYYNVLANETWAYENVARNFVVHFLKEGARYREISDLAEAIVSHQYRDRAWQLSDLIKQRAAVSPVLGLAARDLEQFEVAFLHAAGLDRRGELLLGEVQVPAERIFEIARASVHEAENGRKDLPAAAHEPIAAINRIMFTAAMAQFRGPRGYNRIEIDMLAPLQKNFVAQLDTANTDTLALECAWLMRNEQLEELGGQRVRREIPLALAAREHLSHATARLTFLAIPQAWDLFLQVKERVSGQVGFSRRAFAARDFSGTQLMLSDLQFYAEIANERQRAVFPLVSKQDFALTPYPFAKIRKSVPLFCYFEIYNLRAAGGGSDYEINYRVISDLTQESWFKKMSRLISGAKESAVSFAHSEAANEDTTPELLALDLSKLTPGTYRLEITVTSIAQREITASMTRALEVEE